MITFCTLESGRWRDAHAWHSQFIKDRTDLVYPRSLEEFRDLASKDQIFCALQDGQFVGLVYIKEDKSLCTGEAAWEIGGLIVQPDKEGLGIGSVLVCMALGFVLFEESALEQGKRVLSHVHTENRPGPRPIFARLKFARVGGVEAPAEELKGLRAKDGKVTGDELWITEPDTLAALAAWCRAWTGKLKDGTPAQILLRDDLSVWADALDTMAAKPAAPAAEPRSRSS